MKISFIQKIVIVVIFFTGLIGFSVYLKNSIYDSSSNSTDKGTSLLAGLPNFVTKDNSGKAFNSNSILTNGKPFFIHLWGTWCGPCEKEFPELLEFTKSQVGKVDFYLVAVNDSDVNVEKFMKRFGAIPSNVHVLIESGDSMLDKFGTYKVPETFFFNKAGKSLTKFVGPQNWMNPSYLNQIEHLAN